MSKRGWIIFIVVTIVLLGGLIELSNSSKINVSAINTNQLQKASKQNGNIADHVFGKADSPIVLTEYGDFQCPYCGDAFPQVKSVTDQYQGQIAFVFRNFPLTSLHPNALAAAAAVEAAGLQGKYWPYHNYIYENQSDWDNLTGSDRTNKFIAYAKQMGLNTSKFATDMAGDNVSQKISFDEALGQKLGVDATPTFYLDGTQVSTTVSGQLVSGDSSGLITLINAELAKYKIALPTTNTLPLAVSANS